MDKREKIAEYLYMYFTVDGAKSMPGWSGVRDSLRQRLLEHADQILSLFTQPPLLSDEEIHSIKNLKYSPDMDEAELFMIALRGVAQAQKDLCIKHWGLE